MANEFPTVPSNGDPNTESNSSTHQSIAERFARRGSSPPAARPRRLSDPSSLPQSSAALRSLPISSKDGLRWLPSPDEQSHGRGSIVHDQTASAPAGTPSLTQHACSSAECSLLRVFGTTELLDSILRFLDTDSILSLRFVNRHWRSTVASSPFLRLHSFVHPQWKRPASMYHLLPLHLPGLLIEEGEPLHLGQWIKVTLTPETARRICPEPRQPVRARSIFEGLRGGLGRSSNDAWPARSATLATTDVLKYESLQITQPPLLGMQAYLIYADGSSGPTHVSNGALERHQFYTQDETDPPPPREPSAKAKLSCDSGITLGFLAETAQELVAAPVSGPSSAPDVKVVFKAIVSFCEADSTPRRPGGRSLRKVIRIG